MNNIKRIYITGATGFIGARLLKALLADGYEIGTLMRDGSDSFRLTGTLGKISIFTGDVRDSETVSHGIGEFRPDAILHLLTYYAIEHQPKDIGVMVDTNVKGTINLLEAARESGVKLFVNAGTCAVYEQKDRPITEEDRVSPQNLYAVTKLQAEEAVRFYALNYGVPGITLRLFPPYGPGDHDRRLIPYIIRSFEKGESPALTTGEQKWDFVYVDDIVEAFLAVVRSYPFKEPYDVINIGTGLPYSIRELVEKVMMMMDKNVALSWGAVPHRKNEVWFNSADIKKAGDILKWSPATRLEDGLRQTIQFFCR